MSSIRIAEFDTWRPGYGAASVTVLVASTTTAAAIFYDEACTQAAPNPQTLMQMTGTDGISYGKFLQPLYTQSAYYLNINSIDQTGITGVPLTTLAGVDASDATVIPTGGTQAGNLDDLFARRIDVRDFGIFLPIGAPNVSAATNNLAIVAAIQAASGLGGGDVCIPAGTYPFTQLILPANVRIVGAGRLATILQSTIFGNVVTITGTAAGFASITIDGVNQVSDSVGVFAANVNAIRMDDVQIQRFDVCMCRYGGSGSFFRNLYISQGNTAGYQCHGFSDNGNGGPITNELWDGGAVQLCPGIGLDIENVDSAVSNLTFRGVSFNTNTGTAIYISGAQNIRFIDGCSMNGNNIDLGVVDGTGTTVDGSSQQVARIEWDDMTFGPQIAPQAAQGQQVAVAAVNASINLSGTLQNCAFRRCTLSYTTVNINSPSNNILAQDCQEGQGIIFGGNSPTAWTRNFTFLNANEGSVVTTNSSPTVIWEFTPTIGDNFYVVARVVARGRNSAHCAFFNIGAYGRSGGYILTFDNLTVPFTPGTILTGQTSKATARIYGYQTPTGSLNLSNVSGTFQTGETVTISDASGGNTSTATVVSYSGNVLTFSSLSIYSVVSIAYKVTGLTSHATGLITGTFFTGTSGWLGLQDLQGTFINNEIVTDTNNGSAQVDGVPYNPGVWIIGITNLAQPWVSDTNFSALFVSAGQNLQLQVTGDNNLTLEWIASVDITNSVDINTSAT
jgi:hypothetical protein